MAVYFIQAGDGGPIKIGFADNPYCRLSKMQSDNHAVVKLLGMIAGGEEEERALHIRFLEHNIRGEWFAPVPEILALAAANRAPARPPREGLGPFAEWLRANKHTYATFGRRINRSAVTVGRLARGERLPDKETAREILRVTGGEVPPNTFYLDEQSGLRSVSA